MQWKWVGGNKTGNAKGIYGEQGVVDGSFPGARGNLATWKLDNSLWMFGGYGYDSNGVLGSIAFGETH